MNKGVLLLLDSAPEVEADVGEEGGELRLKGGNCLRRCIRRTSWQTEEAMNSVGINHDPISSPGSWHY